MNVKRLACGFHEDEGGQVAILFAFASIGFVLMLAFIINTAQQTSRKIEMQDAADSTAVVGATWIARGMNLIAFDNKAMADITGMMIDIHSVRQASDVMPVVIAAAAAALEAASLGFATAIAGEMLREATTFWGPFISTIDGLDTSFQNAGWQMLGALSDLNVGIAEAIPFLAVTDGAIYGNRNGLPGTIAVFPVPPLPLPTLPVMRSGKERLAIHANGEDTRQGGCCLSILEPATVAAMGVICIAGGAPLTYPLWIPLFLVAVPVNVSSLKGNASAGQYFQYSENTIGNLENSSGQSLQDLFNQYNTQQSALQNGGKPVDFNSIVNNIGGVNVGIFPLQWPNPAPLPMVLTDTGKPTDYLDSTPPAINLLVVRRRLQYLALTRAPTKFNGFLAGAKFVNPIGLGWVTYAEADVYNPINWDTFQQTWRGRLARASTVGNFFGIDTSFVNNH